MYEPITNPQELKEKSSVSFTEIGQRSYWGQKFPTSLPIMASSDGANGIEKHSRLRRRKTVHWSRMILYRVDHNADRSLTQYIEVGYERSQIGVIAFVDFSAAYDIIKHKVLYIFIGCIMQKGVSLLPIRTKTPVKNRSTSELRLTEHFHLNSNVMSGRKMFTLVTVNSIIRKLVGSFWGGGSGRTYNAL